MLLQALETDLLFKLCTSCALSQPFRSINMSESAEALAANLKSRRNVTIEITNVTNTYCLLDPV